MIDFVFVCIFMSLSLLMFLIGRWLFVENKDVQKQVTLIALPILGAMTLPLSKLLPTSSTKLDLLQRDMWAAGRLHKHSLVNFLAVRNLILFATILAFAAMVAFGLFDGYEWIVAGVVLFVGLLIVAIPSLLLSAQAKRRKLRIEKAIPDALDLIAMAVAGGMPIASALPRVHQELRKTFPDLAVELGIIGEQARTGSLEFAFEQFAERIQIPEAVAWSSLMQQCHRLGGSIVDSLAEYSNRIRENRANRIERSGNTASIKLLLPVVTCICPPIAVMLIGPALLDLRDFVQREGDSANAAVSQFNEIRDQVIDIDAGNR